MNTSLTFSPAAVNLASMAQYLVVEQSKSLDLTIHYLWAIFPWEDDAKQFAVKMSWAQPESNYIVAEMMMQDLEEVVITKLENLKVIAFFNNGRNLISE